jgi:DNA-binding transcriptional ArsR family regulator
VIDGPELGDLARTIGDPSRMRMLTLLVDGRALTAKELAYGAGVVPATATFHLRRLLETGIVTSLSQGRFKYFRLASPEVGKLLESFMVIAPTAAASGETAALEPIRVARFCYDHLAGQLGTRLTDALIARRYLAGRERTLSVTARGETWCRTFGIPLPALRRSRRELAYRCLDWSERRGHLAGALGAAVAERMLALGWIARKRDSRVVAITARGARALKRSFGLSFAAGA